MALFKNGVEVKDDWVVAEEGTPVPSGGKVILSKRRFVAERAELSARNAPVGLVLEAGETVDGLEADISRLALVVLRFPKYTDGRLYSVARLLRDRHGYRGELRASGDVLRDQVTFMLRAGIDAFDVTHPGTIAAILAGETARVTHHYQPASADTREQRPAGRPWLRLAVRPA